MGSTKLTVRDVEGIAELRRVGGLQQRVAILPILELRCLS